MKVKINGTNLPKIADKLMHVNYRAKAHTATASEIFDAAANAEQQLRNLGFTQKERVGAIAIYQSGSNVPQSYRYQRIINRCTMYRGSSGWFVTDITPLDVWPNIKRGVFITLTADQDAIAVTKLRDNYRIAKPQPVETAQPTVTAQPSA